VVSEEAARIAEKCAVEVDVLDADVRGKHHLSWLMPG
jgi:hypothetical protein